MLEKFQRPDDSELKKALKRHEEAVDRTASIIQSHMNGDIDEDEMAMEVAEVSDGLNPGEVVHNAVNRVEKRMASPVYPMRSATKEAYKKVSLLMRAKQVLLGLFT